MPDINHRRELFRQLLAQEGLDLTSDDQSTCDQTSPRSLTAAQRRVWFQQQIDPSSVVYNLTCGVRITGEIDVDRLRRAVEGVAHHHSILRTVYSTDGQEQSIRDDLTPTFIVETVTDLAVATERARQISRQPFDLTAESPLRFLLLLREADPAGQDGASVLIVVIHHIAADDASWAVLFPELFNRYRHNVPPHEGEPIHYSDCVSWQEQALAPQRHSELIKYWRDVLSPFPNELKLPFDHDRPDDGSDEHGEATSGAVDRACRDALINLAQRHHATLFMTGLAVTAVLLHRHTGQNDVTIGIPAILRDRWNAQSMIGNFQNTLIIRLSLDGDMTFSELLSQVKQRCTAAYAHQDLPFDQLVAELRPPRHPGRTPWIDVLFLEQSRALAGATCPELELEEIIFHNGTSQFDLTFAMSNLADGLEILSLYRTTLFDTETVDALIQRWITIAETVVDDPDCLIRTLAITAPTHPSIPEKSYTHTGVTTNFWTAVEQFGNKPALIEGDTSLTYRELADRAMVLVKELRRKGVSPGSPVAVLAHPTTEALVALLATTLIGAIHIPIDADNPAERIDTLLTLADPLVVCIGPNSTVDTQRPIIDLAALQSLTTTGDTRTKEPPYDATAYLIFTSGSTGEPKGVMVNHRNLARLFSATGDLFKFTKDDRWLLSHSLAFDFSVWEVWGAWTTGGCLIVSSSDERRDPDALAALINRHRVTVLNQTPTAFIALAPALLRANADALRWVIFGGEELDPRSLRNWFDHRGERTGMVNMYGITETTVHATWRPITPADAADGRGLSPIGAPLPDLSIDIVDPSGVPVPFGIVGEIVVGGAGVTDGYLNNPELTARHFRFDTEGRPHYWSGDLARRRRDGQLDYLGRLDNQLQVRGFRIESNEVEARLRDHPAITQAAVVAEDQQLVAHVVLTEETTTSQEVRAWVAQQLPAHMVPDRVHQWDQLPRTTSGKLDRAALLSGRAPRLRTGAATNALVTSGDGVAATVSALWSTLLNVTDIGLRDNFFDLGGHSLLLAQLRDELAKRTGVHLSMAELYANPTLEALIQRMKNPTASTPDKGQPGASTRAARQRDAMLRGRRIPRRTP